LLGNTAAQHPEEQEHHMGFATEFKSFAMKGNVVDLAVGVIIGAAFGKIVDSIVKDLIMPVIGRLVGGLDFSNYFWMLANPPADFKGPMTYEALTKAGVPAEMYLFEHGGHGMGMRDGLGTSSEWPDRAKEWLKDRGLLTPAQSTANK
jgi:hypothetical protein